MKASILMGAVFCLFCLGIPRLIFAHCDTLDGPVVADAKKALEKNNITPVLKWVKKDCEKEVRNVFEKTEAVRAKGPEARELADMYFFETLVRLHRAGEGAPYTGLQPAGTKLEPGVAAADNALESGSVDQLTAEAAARVERAIRERFLKAAEKKKHADERVEAGREYVEAYVDFMHFVEEVYSMAEPGVSHTKESGKEPAVKHSEHGKAKTHEKQP